MGGKGSSFPSQGDGRHVCSSPAGGGKAPGSQRRYSTTRAMASRDAHAFTTTEEASLLVTTRGIRRASHQAANSPYDMITHTTSGRVVDMAGLLFSFFTPCPGSVRRKVRTMDGGTEVFGGGMHIIDKSRKKALNVRSVLVAPCAPSSLQ